MYIVVPLGSFRNEYFRVCLNENTAWKDGMKDRMNKYFVESFVGKFRGKVRGDVLWKSFVEKFRGKVRGDVLWKSSRRCFAIAHRINNLFDISGHTPDENI